MTDDDRKQLAELDSQRADVLAHRDRLREELREVPAKLHLIDVRRRLVENQQSTLSAGRKAVACSKRRPADAPN